MNFQLKRIQEIIDPLETQPAKHMQSNAPCECETICQVVRDPRIRRNAPYD